MVYDCSELTNIPNPTNLPNLTNIPNNLVFAIDTHKAGESRCFL